MKVSSRMRSGVLILSVHGRVFRHRADAFSEWIEAEIGNRWEGPMLFDVREMTYVNSAGMRTILRVSKRINRHGGRFALCGLAEGIDRAFAVLGFNQIMDIHDSVEEALAALSGPVRTGA